MRIKWNNIFAFAAILVLIVVLGQVGGSVSSFFESLSDNSPPRHRTPDQVFGAIVFVVLFIACLYAIKVYQDIKDR